MTIVGGFYSCDVFYVLKNECDEGVEIEIRNGQPQQQTKCVNHLEQRFTARSPFLDANIHYPPAPIHGQLAEIHNVSIALRRALIDCSSYPS